MPLHNRKFVFGTQQPLGFRLKDSRKTMFMQNHIEDLMIRTHYLEDAPFKWASVYIFYGKNEFNKRRIRINKTHEKMAMNHDLDRDVIKWADWENTPLFRDMHMIACLVPLLYVGNKYGLNTDLLQAQFDLYAPLPNTIEEAEKIVADNRVVHTDENIREIEERFKNEENFVTSL